MGGSVSGPVLIVEDDPSIRQLLCDALEQDGLEIASASDGEEAIAFATRYLAKPFEIGDLVRAVRDTIELPAAVPEGSQTSPAT